MRVQRVIKKRIERHSDGLNIVGDINGAISANVNEPGAETQLRTRSSNRIVQRGGKTQIISDHQIDDGPTHSEEVNE